MSSNVSTMALTSLAGESCGRRPVVQFILRRRASGLRLIDCVDHGGRSTPAAIAAWKRRSRASASFNAAQRPFDRPEDGDFPQVDALGDELRRLVSLDWRAAGVGDALPLALLSEWVRVSRPTTWRDVPEGAG